MIVELRDQHMRQQVRACHAARDRTAWGWFLHHFFAAAAGFLDPGDLDHPHLGGDHVEQFADIFADHAQITATVRAASAGVQFAAFARGRIRDTRAAAQSGRIGSVLWRLILPFVDERLIVFGHRHQQVFERQLQLFNLAFDLFRGFAEGQFLEFRDP